MPKKNIYSFSSEEKELVKRFKESLLNTQDKYFDIEEFDTIIDYLLVEEQFEIALVAVELAQKQHDWSMALDLRKAQVLLALRKAKEAFEILTELEKKDPNLTNLNEMLIYAHLKMNKRDEALQMAKDKLNAIKETKERREVLTELIYYFKKDYWSEGCLALYELEYDREPTHDLLLDISNTAERSGKFHKVIAANQKFLEEFPYSEQSWHSIGLAYLQLNEWEKALEALEYALAIDPEYDEAIYNHAIALLHTHKFEEALARFYEYKKIMRHDIDEERDAECYYFLGVCYLNLKNYKKSIQNFNKANEGYFSDELLFRQVGMLLREVGQIKESTHFFKKAELAGVFSNPLAAYYLALSYLELNAYHEAITALKFALRDFSSDEDLVALYALIQGKYLNNLNEAIEAINLQFGLIKQNADILIYLATFTLKRDISEGNEIDQETTVALLEMVAQLDAKKIKFFVDEVSEYKNFPKINDYLIGKSYF